MSRAGVRGRAGWVSAHEPLQRGQNDQTSREHHRTQPAQSSQRLNNKLSVVSADGLRRGDGDAVRLTSVPYHAWANRREGPMRVWIPEA
ncbi:hypothetical protein [Streptomyces dysideae]|uniref:hypothetical protein n=1 Tax=Streptomyces dysideae TaxID=909626 RepID=UPI00389A5ABA